MLQCAPGSRVLGDVVHLLLPAFALAEGFLIAHCYQVGDAVQILAGVLIGAVSNAPLDLRTGQGLVQ